jgi:hypothetical protein
MYPDVNSLGASTTPSTETNSDATTFLLMARAPFGWIVGCASPHLNCTV